MGVSRSRDDYRLGKPILHARYLSPSPFPSLWVLCSFHHFFLSLFSLSLRPPFLRRVTLSLSPSLSNPQEHSVGPDSGPFARRRSLLAFSTDEPCLPSPTATPIGRKRKVSRTVEREKERDCGQAEARHTRTLSPKLDTIERTSIPSVITFVSLMLARPPGYLSLRSRARIRSSIDLHPAGPLFRVSARPGPILL